MIDVSIDPAKYEYTTKNILERLNFEEKVISTKDSNLKFYFDFHTPYLLMDNKTYPFETIGSMIFFLQKLSLNSTLIASLSNETLARVANERLQNYHSPLNLVINTKMDQIFTVTSMSADLVDWRKIIEAVYEVFLPLKEKLLYMMTDTGLGISIKMNDDNSSDLDVLRIEPQTTSSILLYRGIAREEVSLRGHDENEIIEDFKEKLQLMVDVDPAISKNYSVVKD